MKEEILVVNTHPGENPVFVGKLRDFLDGLGVEHHVIEGYEGEDPLERAGGRVILTGVPFDVSYSLAQVETKRAVDRAFGWLRYWQSPVLGICFGHQILAHVFGGEVASLQEMVQDRRHRLILSTPAGIFSGIETLEVFAEHRDYVSLVPERFAVLAYENGIPYIIYDSQREMYGVQFVPEQSDDRTREALRRFVLE